MVRYFFPRLASFSALAVLALSASDNALASACDSVFYSQYQACQVSALACAPYASPEEFISAHPHCFSGGASSSQVVVSGSSFQQIGSISSALFMRLLGNSGPVQLGSSPAKGMAAGGKNAWNVWGNIGANDTRQSYTLGGNSIGFDSNIVNTVFGVDYALAPGMVVGVSGAFDRGDGTSRTNGNPFAATSKGYAVAPYIGYQISKELALDATVGIGSGKVYSAGSAESEADRLFYGVNLGYSSWIKDVQLTGKLGYQHGEEDFGLTKVSGVTQNNTAVKSKLDRWQLGAQAGYWLGKGVMPYASLAYLADRRTSSRASTDPIGKSAWQWGLGVNFFSLASGVTGGLGYTQEDSRSNQKNEAVMANIGVRF